MCVYWIVKIQQEILLPVPAFRRVQTNISSSSILWSEKFPESSVSRLLHFQPRKVLFLLSFTDLKMLPFNFSSLNNLSTFSAIICPHKCSRAAALAHYEMLLRSAHTQSKTARKIICCGNLFCLFCSWKII